MRTRFSLLNRKTNHRFIHGERKSHSQEALDDAATNITGIDLLNEDIKLKGVLRKQILSLVGSPINGLQSRKIYEPTSHFDLTNVTNAKPKWCEDGLRCAGCGGPRSNFSGKTCRKCYASKANETFKKVVLERISHRNEIAPMVSHWMTKTERYLETKWGTDTFEFTSSGYDDPLALILKWEELQLKYQEDRLPIALYGTESYDVPEVEISFGSPKTKETLYEYKMRKGLMQRSQRSKRKHRLRTTAGPVSLVAANAESYPFISRNFYEKDFIVGEAEEV